MPDSDDVEQLLEELTLLQPSAALEAVQRWLAAQKLDVACSALMKEIASDPSKWMPPSSTSAAGTSAS